MQFARNLPIKFKLFLSYALVSLVVFFLSFSLLFFQVRKNLEHRIREELGKANQTLTDMVETAGTVSIKNHLRAIAEKNREIIEFLYQKYQKGEISESEARTRAVQILLSQTVGKTGYIYCIDSKGIAVVHPRKGVMGQDLSIHRFIQDQLKRKSGYLEYDWKNPDEEVMRPKALYMTYFEPWDWIISVSSYKSEFNKLISIDDFRDRIKALTFGETGYSYILDTTGKIVIHPEVSGNIMDAKDNKGRHIVSEMLKLKNGFITYTWKNPSDEKAREKFVAFNTIESFGWIIASSSYTREVFSPLFEMQRIFIAILAMSLLIIGGVTLAVSASITRPLTGLVNTLEKGWQEDFSFRMDETREDEIGKLAQSFNRFMERLETYRHKLITEIRDRKEAQGEIDSLRNYLVNIIDSMPSVLVGVDKGGHVTLWNKRAEEVTGISMTDAGGLPLISVFPWLGSHSHHISQSLEEDTIHHVSKVPYTDENGAAAFRDITIYPLIAGGIKDAVIRMDDVTEKIRMEEALIQSEKMVSVGGLAAGMAHEINNPLAGVIQNANVLASRLTDEKIPANLKAAQASGTSMESIQRFMEMRKIPRIIDAIIDSGLRMSSIVNNMLSFARKGDLAFSSHDPADLMEKSLELAATDYNLKKQHDFKSISIEREYEENLPMLVCEGTKIRQVLLNIFSNGAHAMFENRKPGESFHPQFTLRISREPAPGMLKMEIQDNGPGMDKDTAKRIFEPFFTTKPTGVGTGLGLSVSYFIITENHKGTMEVVSGPGRGTNFIIRLPLNPKA